jgi:hypothetical protein
MLATLWAMNSSNKILASQNFGRAILGKNQAHRLASLQVLPKDASDHTLLIRGTVRLVRHLRTGYKKTIQT